MKLSIRDAATLATVKPLDTIAYLRSKGWSHAKQQVDVDRVSVWTFSDAAGAEYECSVPLESELRDYSLRIADVLKVIEAVEQRSQLEIYKDLLLTSADVIRIRLLDPELSDGSVSIDEGAEVFPRAKELILSAACSAVEPKAYFPSRKPEQAMEYLRNVRLGQTEQGSFVLTIISKVTPAFAVGNGKLPDIDDEPFERRVTRGLARSLAAVKTAAREAVENQTIDGFVRMIGAGVSANLCNAIVGLAKDQDGDRQLEFSFGWSANRPIDSETVSRVVFSADAFPAIREAGKLLKESAPIEDFSLEGPVVMLDSTTPDSGGRITVAGIVEGVQRKVTLELPGEDYIKAVNAHRTGNLIRCRGSLGRDGRRFILNDANPVEVVVDDEPQLEELDH